MKKFGEWRDVADAARTTIGLGDGIKEPPSWWKKRVLLAEHSPIRIMRFNHVLQDIKSWSATHLTRHSVGFLPFVKTQRTDRTGIDRGKLPQDEPVDMRIDANAQSIINTSRKRLCSQASPETTGAWEAFLEELRDTEPELFEVCVPECVYRGFCPEFKSCGYCESDHYADRLKKYRKVDKEFER